jgi:hypothetical protein
MQLCIDYIYEKPMKVGFIDNPSDGLLGIARDYEGKPMPIYLRDGLVGSLGETLRLECKPNQFDW